MLKAKTPQKHVSVIQIYSNVGPLNRVAVVSLPASLLSNECDIQSYYRSVAACGHEQSDILCKFHIAWFMHKRCLLATGVIFAGFYNL